MSIQNIKEIEEIIQKVDVDNLIKEIESCNYQCEAGSLKYNKTWTELRFVLKTYDFLTALSKYWDEFGCEDKQNISTLIARSISGEDE